ADLQALLVAVVPFGDARVEIPAVVIEARGRRDALRVVERQFLELLKSDDDVGDLDAGVVDVVLHFHWMAAKPQDAHQRVAERRVAQVADVRGLVRVDRGVLDDRFLWPRRRSRERSSKAEAGEEERGSIEKNVKVAVRRRID